MQGHIARGKSELRRKTRNATQTRHDSYFFFQAEDGIRDYKVTGVQTCALPISREVTVVPVSDESRLRNLAWIEGNRRKVDQMTGGKVAYIYMPDTANGGLTAFNRSEERRVGEECRSRWSPYH